MIKIRAMKMSNEQMNAMRQLNRDVLWAIGKSVLSVVTIVLVVVCYFAVVGWLLCYAV